MSIVNWTAWAGVGMALGLGCVAAPESNDPSAAERADTSSFAVMSNSTTAFDATYELGERWARVEVRYSPTTTLYRLTTSFGSTPLAYAGTQQADPTLLGLLTADGRQRDGFVELRGGDPEMEVVVGLWEALLAMGAEERPAPDARGSTLYAAAYTAARVLGLVHLRDPNEPGGDEPPRDSSWPYPGYESQEMLPPELRAEPGQQSFLNFHCCGPMNCTQCEYNGAACDDWCAAGDFCHNGGYGSCGSICPGISCPHSDSSTLNAYSSGPCNTRPKSFCYWNYGPSYCH